MYVHVILWTWSVCESVSIKIIVLQVSVLHFTDGGYRLPALGSFLPCHRCCATVEWLSFQISWYVAMLCQWYCEFNTLLLGMNSILVYVGHELLQEFFPFTVYKQELNHLTFLTANLVALSLWMLISYYWFSLDFFVKVWFEVCSNLFFFVCYVILTASVLVDGCIYA